MIARHERTSADVAAIAGRVMQRGWAWPHEAKALAASALTQTADKVKA